MPFISSDHLILGDQGSVDRGTQWYCRGRGFNSVEALKSFFLQAEKDLECV